MTLSNQLQNNFETSKKLIIFDFDGVIGDTFQQAFEALNLASVEYGFTPFSSSQEFYNDINVTLKTAPSLALNRFKQYGILKGTLGILNQLINSKKYKHGIVKHFGPLLHSAGYFEGIPELLEQLQSQAELVILSNNQAEGIIKFLDRNSLAKYFNEVHGFETTMVKTETLKKLIHIRKIDLNNIVFITDMATDVKDARPLNMKVLAVSYGYNTYHKIERSRPSKIVNSVEEIYPALEEMLKL